MKVNNNLDVSYSGAQESLFVLIKQHLDSIKTKKEFQEFVESASDSLMGCHDYINAISFTDKKNLIDAHQLGK